MGLHFHDWFDYNGAAFLGFWGVSRQVASRDFVYFEENAKIHSKKKNFTIFSGAAV